MKLRDSSKQGDDSRFHPPCSVSLAPSYFHFLISWSLYSEDDDELNHKVSEELQHSRKEF